MKKGISYKDQMKNKKLGEFTKDEGHYRLKEREQQAEK